MRRRRRESERRVGRRHPGRAAASLLCAVFAKLHRSNSIVYAHPHGLDPASSRASGVVSLEAAAPSLRSSTRPRSRRSAQASLLWSAPYAGPPKGPPHSVSVRPAAVPPVNSLISSSTTLLLRPFRNPPPPLKALVATQIDTRKSSVARLAEFHQPVRQSRLVHLANPPSLTSSRPLLARLPRHGCTTASYDPTKSPERPSRPSYPPFSPTLSLRPRPTTSATRPRRIRRAMACRTWLQATAHASSRRGVPRQTRRERRRPRPSPFPPDFPPRLASPALACHAHLHAAGTVSCGGRPRALAGEPWTRAMGGRGWRSGCVSDGRGGRGDALHGADRVGRGATAARGRRGRTSRLERADVDARVVCATWSPASESDFVRVPRGEWVFAGPSS